MSDPDGLTEAQRALVNAAHQAIVVSVGLSASRRERRAVADDVLDEGAHIAETGRRSRDALAAADAAGVPRGVLDRAVRSALVIGREQGEDPLRR